MLFWASCGAVFARLARIIPGRRRALEQRRKLELQRSKFKHEREKLKQKRTALQREKCELAGRVETLEAREKEFILQSKELINHFHLKYGELKEQLRKERRSNRSSLLPARPQRKPSRYLSITAVVRNEGRYLPEWLEFHRLVGVEHVYLYDNDSSDDSNTVLDPFIRDGYVTVLPWATFERDRRPQKQAYAHALINFGPEWRWMALIDLDEFLFPLSGSSLAETLRAFEDCPAVVVPWHMFGFSGHDTPPDGLVIENYTMRAPFPGEVGPNPLLRWKSIVFPARVEGIDDVHFFHLTGGLCGGYDENMRVVQRRKGIMSSDLHLLPPSSHTLRLNHYFTRSRQEFAHKAAKANFGMNERWRNRRQARADMIEAHTVYDGAVLRFVPELRSKVGVARAGEGIIDRAPGPSCHPSSSLEGRSTFELPTYHPSWPEAEIHRRD